jgi:photosystem II stability/assembly factor-like uncharacterized protein
MLRIVLAFILLAPFFPEALAQTILWEPAGSGIDRARISQIVPVPNGSLFAWTTMSGVFRSTDRGEEWRRVASFEWMNSMVAGPDGVLYASAELGTLFRSTDDGETWHAMHVDDKIGTLAAGAPGEIAGIANGTTFYRSTDSGVTWRHQALPIESPNYITRLLIAPDGDIYATHGDLTLVSQNHGASWGNAGALGSPYAMTIDDAGTRYVSTVYGLMRSTDAGATWRKIDTIKPRVLESGPGGILLAGFFQPPSRIIEEMISTDHAASWRPIHHEVTDWTSMAPDHDLYTLDRSGILRSTDSGVTWIRRTKGLDRPLIDHLVTGPGGRLYAVINAGIFRAKPDTVTCFALYGATGRADQWTLLCDSVDRYVHVDPSGVLFASRLRVEPRAGYRDRIISTLMRSTDGGATWRPGPVRGGSFPAFFGDGRGLVMIGNVEQPLIGDSLHGLLRSTDFGASWDTIDVYANVAQLLRTSRGSFISAHKYNGAASTHTLLQRSTDEGRTWMDISGVGGFYPTLMALPDGTLLFLAESESLLKRSTDDGLTWTDAGEHHVTLPVTTDSSGAVFGGRPFAGGTPKLLARSTDAGGSWTVLPDSILAWQMMVDARGALYVIDTGHVLRRSTDRGESWEMITAGLPDTADASLTCVVQGSGGELFAGTWGKGVFRSGRPARVDPVPAPPEPLLGLYPNPCTSEATVRFRLERAGEVRLTLFDRLGGRVRVFIGGYQAGVHTVTIPTADLAEGVYLCRITGEADGALRLVKVAR